MSEYEWDRTTMAVVASALSGDSDGAVELLRRSPSATSAISPFGWPPWPPTR